jgi:hypothetical protein
LAILDGYNSTPRVVPPQIAIKIKPGVVKPRTFYRLPIAPMKQVLVHNNSLANATRAVAERVFLVERQGVFQPPPAGNARVFNRRMRGMLRKLARTLGKGVPLTNEQFIGLYAGRRKTIYSNAVASLDMNPLTRRDSYVKAFVKAEKTILTQDKPDPAPRLIQPRDPRYNVEVGKYLKPIEHKIYAAIDHLMGFGGKSVMKGLNAVDRGRYIRKAWESIPNPVAISLDASRFDQHVRKYALKWEHNVYKSHYSNQDRKKLDRLLRMQLANKGKVRTDEGNVGYVSDGGRASGDMNTAVGNVLLMTAMLYSFIIDYNIPFRIIDDGDDCMLIVSRGDVDRFYGDIRPWFLEMGFTMKVEQPVHIFEHIEFCQTRPVYANGRWVMVRTLPNSIIKDCHTLLPLSSGKAVKNFYSSIGHCGLALTSGVPILQEFYKLLIRSSMGAKGFGAHTGLESGMLNMSVGLESKESIITTEARVSFYNAFGYTPDYQVAIERELKERINLPDSVDSTRYAPREFINMEHWLIV